MFDSLKNREMFDSACYNNTIATVRVRIKEEKVVKTDNFLDGLKNKMDTFGARKLDYLRERGRGHGYSGNSQ